MRKFYGSIVLFLLPLWCFAQVTTDPSFVLHDQPVKIIYDATQGQGDLEGAAKVYMHAGVVTSSATGVDWKYVKGNWGKDDGIGQMTKVAGETDKWEITLNSPREYFGVPASETIYRIGMVFRNADGTKEGKDEQGSDIFVQVYEGLAVKFTNPADASILLNAGDPINLQAEASAASDLSITVNGQVIASAANTTIISHNYVYPGTSAKEVVEVIATDGSATAKDVLEIITKVNSPVAAIPAGLKQGLNITGPNEATFVLLAPLKSSVYLIGSFNNWQLNQDYLMNRDGELFWLTVPNLEADTQHAYYYLVDQTIDVADPYSEVILDRFNDQYITDQRYPGLPPFPTQAAADVVTLFKINEAEYNWQATDYTRPKKEDLIIYELLVRDFSAAESFQGVIDRLDYLDSLNITAIQLMPIMEFNGNDSWGYNPTFMTALDKWYGAEEKLKELIDKAHQRGMAVILDITLNHQDYPNPFLKMWWSGTTASPENPFFNVTPTHPFNVFTDMNHESAYTQHFVDRVNRYWLEEFNIDGFRFDLSKGFTQQNNPDDVGAWSAYDASRIAILKRMADKIWEVDPNAYVILEHFADNSEEKVLADYGMMLWGNLNHSYSEAAMGYNLTGGASNFNWISWKQRGWSQPNVVGYMESHDEERMMYRLLQYGNSSGDYNTKNLNTALDRVKLAAAFFIPVPGPKMIWQFGEFGYDISIEQNGRTGKKPLKWDYLQNPDRQELFRTFSALNHLKTEYPVFETSDYQLNGSGEIRTLKLNGADMNVLVVGNFGLSTKTATVNFQHTGWWYSYFYKDSIQASSTSTSITLEPGEFHLYMDKPIFIYGSNPLGLEETQFAKQMALYPNPATGKVWVSLPLQSSAKASYKIMDTTGRSIQQGVWQYTGTGGQEISVQQLPAGVYLLQIEQGQNKAIKRFIKQ